MKKVAYLVLGTESSATRYVTMCLIKSGCVGDNDHHQKWDFEKPHGDKIVWRRSYPHKWDDPNNFPYVLNNTVGWPDTDSMYELLNSLDYEIKVVVTHRDWHAINSSATRIKYRPHTSTIEKCTENTKQSYKRIFEFILKYDLDYIIFSYEAAILNGDDYINQMLTLLGLSTVKGFSMKNANKKYY